VSYVSLSPTVPGAAKFDSGGGFVAWKAVTGAELIGQSIRKVDPSYFARRILVGAVPTGDTTRQWTALDFAGWYGH
jgi:hypothetical protein